MKEIEIAKKIILEEIEKAGLKLIKILLFGSRVRDEHKKDSDWDFYVIVDKDLDHKQKWEIIREINEKLLEMEIPNDIIINSVSWAEKYQNDVGRITYYALKEGIEI